MQVREDIKRFECSFCSIFCLHPPSPPHPSPQMQSISQPAYLSNESFWRFRNTSYWIRLFSTGALIIVIYWKPHTAGRPSDSQWLPPAWAHFFPWRQGSWEPAVISKQCLSLKSESVWVLAAATPLSGLSLKPVLSGGSSLFLHLQLARWKEGWKGGLCTGWESERPPTCYSLHFFPRNLRNT